MGRFATGLLCASLLLGCTADQSGRSEEGDRSGDEAARILVEDAVLATSVDPATLLPSGTEGRSFPGSTRLLYVSFRVAEAGDGGAIVVSWLREGEEEPFSTTRLAVTGRRQMATAYEPIGTFDPGRYVVRLSQGERLLAEVPFEVRPPPGGGVPPPEGELTVSALRFFRALGEDGRPTGAAVTIFPQGTKAAHCAFTVTGASADSRVEVRWLHGGRRIASAHVGTAGAEARDLVASLSPASGLEAGLYRAEVVVGGSAVRAGAFTVEGEAPPGGAGPRVSNLVLTTEADERSGRPTGPRLTAVRGDEPVLYLTFTFAGMPDGGRIEVRWYRDADAETPIATGTYAVAGRGALAASLEPGEPLARGGHHVDIVRAGSVLGTLAFTVDRPEAPDAGPDEPDAGR